MYIQDNKKKKKCFSAFDPNSTNLQDYLRGIAVNFQLQL
jgi:hypothetical protein